jgi:hypothetical protein
MDVITVKIRRGVTMYPVFDIPITNTHTVRYDANKRITAAFLSDEVIDWLTGQGLPDDTMSNDWTLSDDWKSGTATFYFAEARMAMLFKLTWA